MIADGMTISAMASGHVDGIPVRHRADQLGIGARIVLADELRALLHALATTDAGDDALLRAATLAGEARAMIATTASSNKRGTRRLDGPFMGFGALSELGPFTTPLHATAPPMDLMMGDGHVEATATYGPAHEGGPGVLHGGFIAATFDELLGVAQRGALRMTGELTIRYRAPAMLHRALRYRTWLDRIEGRKAFVKGTLHDGETLCAEASAIFITLKNAPFALP